MAKVIGLVFALFVLAFATIAQCHKQEVFTVEGDVYCDPCRVQFQNPLSEKLAGAAVKLECVNLETKAVTYSVEGVTDGTGKYSLKVSGDHENDSCSVKAVKSPKPECSEPLTDVELSRVDLTENIGIHSDVRFANPIGFMTKDPHAQCISVLQDIFSDQD
ncbi:Pollen Ole e 1 allergen and extensin family protein [Striga hermonthica]|uniref:Pollen Ole e 1 allergen and extensin family protein n=1 Tax=Striga hermonthica TaxID=68872 RepID=A0A9N7MNT0_STRHE|nr:Pollen Ole e 1 allergen and extensin family protein [Striga hermonthica]